MEGKVSSTELTLRHKGIHVHTPLQEGRTLQHTPRGPTHLLLAPPASPWLQGTTQRTGTFDIHQEHTSRDYRYIHTPGGALSDMDKHVRFTQDPEAWRVIPGPMDTLYTKKIIHTNGI